MRNNIRIANELIKIARILVSFRNDGTFGFDDEIKFEKMQLPADKQRKDNARWRKRYHWKKNPPIKPLSNRMMENVYNKLLKSGFSNDEIMKIFETLDDEGYRK